MKLKIAILAGDGIGPEVTAQAVRVLEAVADRHGHTFEFEEWLTQFEEDAGEWPGG